MILKSTYFASASLTNDPRWRSGSIYLFGLDDYGYTLSSSASWDPVIGLSCPPISPVRSAGSVRPVGAAPAGRESDFSAFRRAMTRQLPPAIESGSGNSDLGMEFLFDRRSGLHPRFPCRVHPTPKNR